MSKTELLDSILEEWDKCRKEITSLEKKADLIKSQIEKKMKDQDVKMLSGNKYFVVKSDVSRKQVVKESIPEELWNKYSKTINYSTYSIKTMK